MGHNPPRPARTDRDLSWISTESTLGMFVDLFIYLFILLIRLSIKTHCKIDPGTDAQGRAWGGEGLLEKGSIAGGSTAISR